MGNVHNFLSSFRNVGLQGRLGAGRKVAGKHLSNVLNFVNFQDESILVNLTHRKYRSMLSLPATPMPQVGEKLDCLWSAEPGTNLDSYEFLHFLVDDGRKLVMARPRLRGMDREGIRFDLSDVEGCEVGVREFRRHKCQEIAVDIYQNGLLFHGRLLDFSASSLGAEMACRPPRSLQWLNPEAPVTAVLREGQDVLYSGECKVLRQTHGRSTRLVALRPLSSRLQRLKPKEFRSRRATLTPMPSAVFRHPFTGKTVTLPVTDISGPGLSVEEYYEGSILLPGMIIPRLDIVFSAGMKIPCRAQVVYRNILWTERDRAVAKCGIAVLDMDIQDQVNISALLHRADHGDSHVSEPVDMGALWEFFFTTGFFYSGKYAHLSSTKEAFKRTYEKLYLENPQIARHFVCQDRGIIQGHMSMVRFWENAWLIHHHAAHTESGQKAGLVVLEQVGRYVNDFHSLYSAHMDFVLCFYRPENKFPDRVFGGLSRNLRNPKGCSLDSFAYLTLRNALSSENALDMRQGRLELTRPSGEDLAELESFYEHCSGGLMLNALDLEPEMVGTDDLSRLYRSLGFKKECHAFSLKKGGVLKAVIMCQVSDIGLNLSNVTNGIYVIVVDADDVTAGDLAFALSLLQGYYGSEDTPLLLFPTSFAQAIFPVEKTYNLWVLNTRNLDDYFRHVERLTRRLGGGLS